VHPRRAISSNEFLTAVPRHVFAPFCGLWLPISRAD